MKLWEEYFLRYDNSNSEAPTLRRESTETKAKNPQHVRKLKFTLHNL